MASREFQEQGQTYNQQLRAAESKTPPAPQQPKTMQRAGRYVGSFLERNAGAADLVRNRNPMPPMPGSPAQAAPSLTAQQSDLSPAEVLEVYREMRTQVPEHELAELDTLAAQLQQ